MRIKNIVNNQQPLVSVLEYIPLYFPLRITINLPFMIIILLLFFIVYHLYAYPSKYYLVYSF